MDTLQVDTFDLQVDTLQVDTLQVDTFGSVWTESPSTNRNVERSLSMSPSTVNASASADTHVYTGVDVPPVNDDTGHMCTGAGSPELSRCPDNFLPETSVEMSNSLVCGKKLKL